VITNTPNKMYYSISEVCRETGLEQHVLRYWETEFPQLKPKKNRAGNRAYRAKEIKLVKYIKYLLYNEKFTIQGAKRKLADTKEFEIPEQLEIRTEVEVKEEPRDRQEILLSVRQDLENLLRKMRQE
jgi:DNA-binding transcriptional MerR regulator